MSVATLPAQWTRRRLRFDARLNPVKSELKLELEAEVSFVPMEAVGELGGLRLDEQRSIDDVYDGYTYFCDGDVVIAKITPCFENGKGALATGLTNGIGFGTTELHVTRPSDTLDPAFLFYLSIAHDFRCLGASEMLGAGGQKRVPERFIKDWMAVLPPLETQRRIATFLDGKTAQIDGLIEKKRALLERLAEKRQAIITQAVTKGLNPTSPMKDSGIDWLAQIPAHWDVKRLRFLLEGDTLNGLYKPKDQFQDDGVPFIQMGEAFRGPEFVPRTKDRVSTTDSELRKWGLRPGDFLIARRSLVFDGSGKSVRIGSTEEPHLFESSMIRLRLLDPEFSLFLSYYLQSSVCRAFVLAVTKQVTISGIDSQQLKNIPVVCPSGNEARSIAKELQRLLVQLDAVKHTIVKSITLQQQYRSALITAAVTGQNDGLR